MASLSSIRTGLETRLATITGLNASDTAPGTITTPAAFPVPGSIEFDESMARGSDLYTFTIKLLVQRATETIAQGNLDPYLAGSGSSSIKAAIEGDGTLGGVADWTRVTGVTAYGDIDHAGIQYLGALFNVEVNVDGT